MAFTPEFLDELRARVPLAGVIGRGVRLTKRGREHVGLCPFHNEKTPSFTINEDKGFYHCFGCGAHGDVIGFAMRADGLTFPEAVAKLAAEAGLALPAYKPRDPEAEEKRASLHDVLEAACVWFAAQLAGEIGKEARAYLEGRGVEATTMAEFRLGYAPHGRDGLRQALAARDFGEALMIEAGLVAKSDEGRLYDRFRDRVIFPITDRRGQVIAFGGRALGEARAKYLNSPETPLFHKGRTLYNLARARAPARQAGTVLVAEGYMDVIALAAAGFGHVVAPLGTALTEAQMQELWRLAPEPVLCLDGDAAGQRAAYRAAERSLPLLKPGHSLLFALLPNGEDPDSLVRRRGPRAMTAVVEAAAPLSDILWTKEAAAGKLDTPERRAALEQRLLGHVREIHDETVKQYYRRHFKSRLWEAFREGRAPRQRWSASVARPPGALTGALTSAAREPTRRREELLLLTLINHPGLVDRALEGLAEAEFLSPELDSLRRAIIDIAGREPALDRGGLKFQLTEQGFSETVDRLLESAVAKLSWFARADAASEDAEMVLNHTLALHRREITLRAQLEVAEAELAKDMTPENEARFLALRRELDESAGNEAELDGYGSASGRDASP
jgi:DNA primase